MNSGRHGMRGAAFVFVNKVRSRIKVLRWDKHGVWLCAAVCTKKAASAGHVQMMLPHLTPDEFNWLIAGVDWQQVKGHDLTKWGWQNEPELRPENTQNTLLTPVKNNEYPYLEWYTPLYGYLRSQQPRMTSKTACYGTYHGTKVMSENAERAGNYWRKPAHPASGRNAETGSSTALLVKM